MIINTDRVYFRYDPSEELYGVVPGVDRYRWGAGNFSHILSRPAPEDLNWEQEGFTDALIRKSTAPKNSRFEIPEMKESSISRDPATLAEFLASRQSRPSVQMTTPIALTIPPEVDPDSDPDSDPEETPASIEQVSDDHVWNLINRLAWVDRDEIVRRPSYVRTRLNLRSRRDLFGGMLRLKAPLVDVFADIAPLQNLDEEGQNNFFFHVIGKGRHFYEFTMQSPEISLYLFTNKVQNLYSFLRGSLN